MALRDRLLNVVFEELGLDGRVERDHETAEGVVDRLLAVARRGVLLEAADALAAARNDCPECLHAEPIVVQWLRDRATTEGAA